MTLVSPPSSCSLPPPLQAAALPTRSTSIFPFEIEETILDFLAEDDHARSGLKACALVCHSFLTICRKHIFRSIILPGYDAVPFRAFTLSRLLCENPEIADHIRELDFTVEGLTSPSIQGLLKQITRLESLIVQPARWSTLDWSNNEIRPALLHLLHLPTLTHFTITRVDNFVVSDLLPCVNLRCLKIGCDTTASGTAERTFPAASPERPIPLKEFIADRGTGAAIMKFCTARRPDGQLLIDFMSLSKVKMTLDRSSEGKVSQELFRHFKNLTHVQISFFEPWYVRPRFADMLQPSMQTLKHLILETRVRRVDDDPLYGIPFELEEMRSKNILESVTIGVTVGAHTDCRHQGDDWGRLDKVLTTRGWFSLKRVSLVIKISVYRVDNKLEVALRKLPQTQFLRLSTSNSVSFKFEVNTFK